MKIKGLGRAGETDATQMLNQPYQYQNEYEEGQQLAKVIDTVIMTTVHQS